MNNNKEIKTITDRLREHCSNAVTVYVAIDLIKR